jgi:hypothetical protein
MAEPDETKSSPFDFSRVPGNDTFRALRSQWEDVLEQPGARTALLQFGISMMQPPSFGDTAFSQMGRAIGAAGEATTAQLEAQRKERESEAKSQLAEARAEAAGQRATGAQERLQAAQERTQAFRERTGIQAANNLLNGYVSYVHKTQQAHGNAMKLWEKARENAELMGKPIPPQPTPPVIMSQDQFAATPMGQALARGAGISAPAAPPGAQPDYDPSDVLPPSATPASSNLQGRGSTAIIETKSAKELEALPRGQRYRRPGDPPGYWRVWKGGAAPTAAEPSARPETEDY